MLEKQDLQAIEQIVTSVIQATVPDMIQEGIRATVPDMIQEGIRAAVPDMIQDGIRATVPDMIDEKIDANTELLLNVIEERAKETESVILKRLDRIEKYYQVNRIDSVLLNEHSKILLKQQREIHEIQEKLGMA